jgi:hypothetical protein
MAVLGSTTLTGCDSIPSFIPTATKVLWQQSAAPTSWTKDTTHDNKALRVVSGTATPGGTTSFTSTFTSRSLSGSVGNTTLSTTQIPSHNHSYNIYASFPGREASNPSGQIWNGTSSVASGAAGGGSAHSHPFSGTALDFSVQYVDIIICSKN